MPERKETSMYPQIIADDPALFKHYMLGLIDTDGHIYNKTVHLKQRDENFLKQLAILLKKHFNIESKPPKVNLTAGKPYYCIRFLNKLQPEFNM